MLEKSIADATATLKSGPRRAFTNPWSRGFPSSSTPASITAAGGVYPGKRDGAAGLAQEVSRRHGRVPPSGYNRSVLNPGVYAAAAVRAGRLIAAPPEVTKVEPPNWWIGHSINPVRLLIRGRNLEGARAVAAGPDLEIGLTRVNAAGTYAFVDVSIAPNAQPGPHPLRLVTAGGEAAAPFEVLQPLPRAGRFQGFSPDDVDLPDHAGPLRQRRSLERRPRRLARAVQPAEAALLPRRRLPGHHRSPALSQGSRA